MTYTQEEMEKRLVRYRDLKACTNAFIDARTPGSDKKENFCLIGPGVSEQPGQHVHVKIPHGFNIGGARQPAGCTNSQHSHDTAEVFMVHSGEWAFRWGHDATDGEAILKPGDVISIPERVFRGFENVGDDDQAFLFAILGKDDPGHVTWAPYVFEAAKGHGLVLLEDGKLVDTALGEKVPEGAAEQKPTTMEDVTSFRTMTAEEMADCVLPYTEGRAEVTSELAGKSDKLEEVAIVGIANAKEGVGAGKMGWPHEFQFRRIDLGAGGSVPAHSRAEEEVIFVHEGSLYVSWDGGGLTMERGDTITIPKGVTRSFANNAAEKTVLFVVRGGDAPAAPTWC